MIGYMTSASVSDVSKKLTNVSCFSPWSHAQGLDVGCSWTKKEEVESVFEYTLGRYTRNQNYVLKNRKQFHFFM